VDKETIEVEKSGKKDRARTREKTLQGNEGKACSGFHEYYQSFFFFSRIKGTIEVICTVEKKKRVKIPQVAFS